MGHALKLKSTEWYRYLPFTASFRWLYYEKKKQKKKQKKTTSPAKALTINIYHNLS